MEKIEILKNGQKVEVKVDIAAETNDGFHTFTELYEQRKILSALAFKLAKEKGWQVWKSRKHYGETEPCFGGGWFHVGVTRPDKLTYSYHYEEEDWSLFDFATELDHSPKWDGHTANDVNRLLELLNQ